MTSEKELGKACTLKNTTVVWDRARYLVACPNVLATTSEVIMNPFNQPILGICGSKLVELALTRQCIKCIAKIKEHGFEAFAPFVKICVYYVC